MSGPVASVLLKNSEEKLSGYIKDLINKISNPVAEEDFWVIDTSGIKGIYIGEGQPFSYEVIEREHFCDKSEIEQIAEIFGFLPVMEIVIIAHCSNSESHRILAEILLEILDNFEGLVDFNGELRLGDFKKVGRLEKIAYECETDEVGFVDIGDSVFLSKWIDAKNFRMIK